ncbi:LysM peptidoglycan-binding domain-containing M23 family metallopeptidase [Oricola thermophila]|uniref:Peptidoglycan DD-metalloendopeptidase family protein n=1 Tax=Oricola thermophila TaxID=2742145 RepID=A0A6N1V9Y8_9HYPH|nr:LysM peptidoglycan-binding domain-containing M23 family metallopeptidase [Oricola thermophila]QKV17756.1 peptidoglycan DD-metalloendopeptidase family protein [Oricola thermophila]
MRNKITSQGILRLARAATILSIGGLAAGCSSDVIRFSDGFYTGAIPQPNEVSQPAVTDYGQPNYDPTVVTGSVVAQPVERTMLPKPSENHLDVPQPATPVATGSSPAPFGSTNVSPVTTASIPASDPAPVRFGEPTAQQQASTPSTTKGGWTNVGATQVALRQGETIYTLARRYGVPANAIMEANGIKDPKTVSAGQKILIPTYVYSHNASVSAPDSDPATQAASAAVGNRSSLPRDVAPAPRPRPAVAKASAAPQRAEVTAGGGRYTVVAGDTLSAISRKTGASIEAIKRVNSMSTDTVRIGQTLVIPGLSAPETQQVAAAPKIDPVTTSKTRPVEDPKPVNGYTPPRVVSKSTEGSITTIETNDTARAPEATGVNTMRWPVQGRIVGAFGSNAGGKPNDGIDISVPAGTPVKAAENGVVIYAGDGLKELGKTVLVRHSDGVVTVYGHVSEIAVKRGDTVKRGQQIASSGMSGSAKQPQLHFEVRKNSKPVNPLTFLQ